MPTKEIVNSRKIYNINQPEQSKNPRYEDVLMSVVSQSQFYVRFNDSSKSLYIKPDNRVSVILYITFEVVNKNNYSCT